MEDFMRQRHVFPTSRVAHLWAHHTQDDARNSQGNLYFRGDTLYSYRDSYPIGRIITIGKGKRERKAVLLQENHYSHTTAQHCSDARGATSHMAQFTVPFLLPVWGNVDHTANLSWYADQITNKVGQAERARQSASWRYRSALEQWQESLQYAKFFKLHKPMSPVKDWDTFKVDCDAREKRAEQLANDPTLDSKRYVARMKREKQRKAHQDAWIAEQTTKASDAIAKWRNGELLSMSCFDYPPQGLYTRHEGYSVRQSQIPTMLRIKGNDVETSHGATFPVSHAKHGLALVRSVMARGEDWESNGHTCKLGYYTIGRITKDGTVYAGCHIVTWPEIERIVPELDKL